MSSTAGVTVRSELDTVVFLLNVYVKHLTTKKRVELRRLYTHFLSRSKFTIEAGLTETPLFLPTEAHVIPAIDLHLALEIARAYDNGDSEEQDLTGVVILRRLIESGPDYSMPLDLSQSDEDASTINGGLIDRLCRYVTGDWFAPSETDMASYLALVRRTIREQANVSDKHLDFQRHLKVLAACEAYVPPLFAEHPAAWVAAFKKLAVAVVDLDWYGSAEEEQALEARTRMRHVVVDLIFTAMLHSHLESNTRLVTYYTLEGGSRLINELMRDPLSITAMNALMPSAETVDRIMEEGWKRELLVKDWLRVRSSESLVAAVPLHMRKAIDRQCRVANAKVGGAIYLPDLLPEAVKRIVGVDTPFEYSDVPAFLRLCGLAWDMLYEEESRREAAGIAQPITIEDIRKAGGAPPPPPPMPEPRQPPTTTTARSDLLSQIRAGPEKGLRKVDKQQPQQQEPREVAERDLSAILAMNPMFAKVRSANAGDSDEEDSDPGDFSDGDNDAIMEAVVEAEAERLEEEAEELKETAAELREQVNAAPPVVAEELEERAEELEEHAEELEERAEEIRKEEPVTMEALMREEHLLHTERAIQKAAEEKAAAEQFLMDSVASKQFAADSFSATAPPNFDVSRAAVGMVSTRKPLYGAINFSDAPVKAREISSFQRGLKFADELRRRIDVLRRFGPYTPRKVLRNGQLEDERSWYMRNRINSKESLRDFTLRNGALLTASMSAEEVRQVLTYNTEILGRLLKEGFEEGRKWNEAWKFVSRELSVAEAINFSKFLFLLGALSRVPTVRAHLNKIGRGFYDHDAHWSAIEDYVAANPEVFVEPEDTDRYEEEETAGDRAEEEEDETTLPPLEEIRVPDDHYLMPLAETYRPPEKEEVADTLPVGARIDAFVWSVEDGFHDMASRARKFLTEKAHRLRDRSHGHIQIVQVSGEGPDTGRFDALVRRHYGDAPFRPGKDKTLARLPDTQMALLDVEQRSDADQRGFVRQFMIEKHSSPGATRFYTVDGVSVVPVLHARSGPHALGEAMASDHARPLVLAHPPVSAFAFLAD